MNQYAAQWYDPALEISADESVKKITKEESERLAKLLAIATAAGAIPRRVGPDATGEELAQDKRRAKRIAHVAGQLLDAWAGPKGRKQAKVEITREAATVDWPRWWEDHQIWLENRRRYIATWSEKNTVDRTWAKGALVRINNELSWLQYAMRD